jgi:hypothetical protein
VNLRATRPRILALLAFAALCLADVERVGAGRTVIDPG